MQIIRNARLRGREGTFDVALEDDRIAAVEPSIDSDADREHVAVMIASWLICPRSNSATERA